MQMDRTHYRRLALMLLLSFGAMYLLMYAMVDRVSHVYSSWNQTYMAGLMTAPMAIIEVAVMRGMYPDRRTNALFIVGSALALVSCFSFIGMQLAVSDRQFLRSMIPHHAGAILMCERASLRDPGLVALCKSIISSQRDEIAKMETKLGTLR